MNGRTSGRVMLAGLVAAIALFAVAPAGAHVGGTVGHLWKKHLKPLALKTFFSKPQSDARYIRNVTRTGYFSCPALAWQEAESSYAYSYNAGERRMHEGQLFAGFHCNAALPHGAEMKAVRFTVLDTSIGETIECELDRRGLATQGDFSTIALAVTGYDEAPGFVRITDATISTPIVDNDQYAYMLGCFLKGGGPDIRLFGASIEYQVTGSAGAAS